MVRGQIAEYGQIKDQPRSTHTVLDMRTSRGREYKLVSATAGWEPAGSVARWTDAFYAVWFMANGSRNGQRFVTEAEARATFEKWTTR